MKGKNLILFGVIGIVIIIVMGTLLSNDPILNSNGSPYFTPQGNLISDTTQNNTCLKEQYPAKMNFYVEVSGSMNGFFRANLPTDFKKDVHSVFSFIGFSKLSNGVNILSNDGNNMRHFSLNDFIRKMSRGEFVAAAETKVPIMLRTILNDTKVKDGEVAVLLSDMKYSPEGQQDMGVLLTLYASEIRNIVNEYDVSYCLVAAVSNYLSATGCPVADKSPYYYLIIGNSGSVAWVRNRLCTLLEDNNSYVDEIENGFDYQSPSFEYGTIAKGAIKLPNEPTYYGIETGECEIPLTIDITNYRWALADEDCFKDCFKLTSTMGSKVELLDIKIEDDHHFDKQLARKTIAKLTIKVSQMSIDSDVLEWTLNVPELAINSQFNSFFGALSEREYDKSFSIESFIEGLFKGSKNIWQTEPNRILISKK